MELWQTRERGDMKEKKVQMHVERVSLEMPAGTYWVGDPCYGVPDQRWMEWLEAADYESNHPVLYAELDGHPVVGLTTAYGDGVYHDGPGNEYPVDAGLIGMVPVAVAQEKPFGMRKVVFDFPVKVRWDEGVLEFGSIRIDTR